ncbi:MAG: methionine--tRNA ligase [Patescibacteria group bacterium]|nr:methionine--tRNA ligase [Patescibacteria group bacterium]
MTKKAFIGVAWPYVNGDLHVGHLAGYLIPADIFSRYLRLKGYKVLMVSGTDCHGTPITFEADRRGIVPQELVDEYTPRILELIRTYRASYDLFTSTTTENHKRISQEFFLNLLRNGYLIRRKTIQYFSPQENRFLPDRYVEGKCSYCYAEKQRADQCEICGRTLEPGELIEPYSRLSQTKLILKETEHYALDLKKLQPRIEEFVRASSHWREWVYRETIGFLREGLKERTITRDLDWGIDLPIDRIPLEQRIEDINNKRLYVWFEAVIGYFSASVEWANISGNRWEDFWLDPDCKHYYFMGKDNLIFHTIFWPAELLGQHQGYNLPYFPAVNNFLLLEGQKFSKSRGVHLDSLVVANEYGVDNVRYYITSILPEHHDTNFKFSELKETVNNELVNKVGNLIHRTLVFYRDKLEQEVGNQLDDKVIKKLEETFKSYDSSLERVEMVLALRNILELVNFANQYFDLERPWQLIVDNPRRCRMVINSLLQVISNLKVMLWPIIPQTMENLSQILGLPIKTKEDYNQLKVNIYKKIKLNNTPSPLFQKI